MVKISNKIFLVGGLATAVGLAGCGKYEDGPNFSLLTKKQRLTGDWEMTKWVPYTGSNTIGDGMEVEMEFDEDGDFNLKIKSTYTDNYGYSYTYSYSEGGDWEFSSDKEEVELDFDNEGDDWEIEITRLTNKEFEGEITNDDSDGTIRFEAEKK